MSRYLSISVFTLLVALAFGTAVMAQSDSDSDGFEVTVTNPYVDWDSTFDSGDFQVIVEPGMARRYSSANTFTVMSTTPFEIQVAVAWDDPTRIEVNPNNNAIGAADLRNNAFDIQLSARGNPSNYTSDAILNPPAAGTKTVYNQRNTLGEPGDAVEYGVTVTLVLVDEQSALPGNYNTSGWNAAKGVDNRRFDSLPAGTYDVNVTITITEDI